MNDLMISAARDAVSPREVTSNVDLTQCAPGDSFTVLGLESSCDETGVGIARVTPREGEPPLVELIADQVASSMEENSRFGGVVPEIDYRAHMEALVPTMHSALAEAAKE